VARLDDGRTLVDPDLIWPGLRLRLPVEEAASPEASPAILRAPDRDDPGLRRAASSPPEAPTPAPVPTSPPPPGPITASPSPEPILAHRLHGVSADLALAVADQAARFLAEHDLGDVAIVTLAQGRHTAELTFRARADSPRPLAVQERLLELAVLFGARLGADG